MPKAIDSQCGTPFRSLVDELSIILVLFLMQRLRSALVVICNDSSFQLLHSFFCHLFLCFCVTNGEGIDKVH